MSLRSCGQLWPAWDLLCRAGWSWANREAAGTPWRLGLKVWASTPSKALRPFLSLRIYFKFSLCVSCGYEHNHKSCPPLDFPESLSFRRTQCMTLKPCPATLFILGSMFPKGSKMYLSEIFFKNYYCVWTIYVWECGWATEHAWRPQDILVHWFSPSSYYVGFKMDLRCGKHLYPLSRLATWNYVS